MKFQNPNLNFFEGTDKQAPSTFENMKSRIMFSNFVGSLYFIFMGKIARGFTHGLREYSFLVIFPVLSQWS